MLFKNEDWTKLSEIMGRLQSFPLSTLCKLSLKNALADIYKIIFWNIVFSYIVSGNAYFAHFFLVSQNPKTLKQAMSAYSQARVSANYDFVKASVFFLF